jgi:hypothetical protein
MGTTSKLIETGDQRFSTIIRSISDREPAVNENALASQSGPQLKQPLVHTGTGRHATAMVKVLSEKSPEVANDKVCMQDDYVTFAWHFKIQIVKSFRQESCHPYFADQRKRNATII